MSVVTAHCYQLLADWLTGIQLLLATGYWLDFQFNTALSYCRLT